MEWRCDAENISGKKVAERLGFALEGVLRKQMIWREANRDTALFGMTNSDWREGAEDRIRKGLRERIKRDVATATARSLVKELDEAAEAQGQ